MKVQACSRNRVKIAKKTSVNSIMNANPETCCRGSSVMMRYSRSLPMMYASNVFPTMNDSTKKIVSFEVFLPIFSAVQGAAARRFCSSASPSMRYSILRNTISIITVCGQVQPHQSRPNAVVNRIIPVRKSSTATAKITASCGQKICPSMENRRSTMFIISNGLPLMRMNGPENITTSSSQLSHVRRRNHFPSGFFG